MADGQSFMPPPRIPGVSEPTDRDGLMRQLAGLAGGGGGESQAELAGPMLIQGMTLLQQAAALDPRISPLVRRALSVLQGGENASMNTRPGQGGGPAQAPGGTVRI